MRIPLIVAMFAGVLCGQSVEQAIKARTAGFEGTVSLYAKNLDTGDSIGIRASEPVRTASTIKLPIMMTVFDAVAKGKAKWTEPLTVTPGEKVSGSGILTAAFSDGVQLPLRDVVNLMIILSDNTATNMVLERFTADAVNHYLDSIGIKATRSMRKVLGDGPGAGHSAAGKLPENQKYGLGKSTPLDMVTLLEKLERGEAVSPEASKEMLAILRKCQDNTGVRRKLVGVPIANKTGALDALRSDVAIVYSKGGRIAMAITVDGMPKTDYTPENVGSILISDLAKLLVEGLAKK